MYRSKVHFNVAGLRPMPHSAKAQRLEENRVSLVLLELLFLSA